MKLAVLVDFPYWEGRIGSAVRIESLCHSLAKVCDLTVISALTVPGKYQGQMAEAPYAFKDRKDIKVICDALPDTPIPGVRADRQVTVRGMKALVETGGYDAVLTPYFNRKWMVEHIDRNILRVIDTIDCQSQRMRSFAAHGLVPTFQMSPQEEKAELELYDIALAISDEDQAEFAALTSLPIITAPFRLPPKPLYSARDTAAEVLFIAAKSVVNDITLTYLIEEVLPMVGRKLTLHVVGNVTIPDYCPPNLRLIHHENVDDLSFVYRSVDLAVNPTYAGGGIKTKTLEAMAYGVPVLTSDEGARGLSNLLPDDLIVNDRFTFAHRIGALLDDPARRMALSKQITANMYAEDREGWLAPFIHILAACKNTLSERQSA